jgi:hypothetical protein
MNTPDRDWVDYLQALLTPAIAVLGFIIAGLQWWTNHSRFKLERFSQRFHIFEATRKFLQNIILKGNLDEQDRITFLGETRGSRFLFDKEISNYLDEIHSKAVEIETLTSELETPSGDEREQKISQRVNLKKWINAQLKTLEDKFAKYF